MRNIQALYKIWLAALAVLLGAFSLGYLPAFLSCGGQADALFLFLMTDILCVLMAVTRHVSWCGCISETEEFQLSRPDCIRIACRQFIFFGISTCLYLYYSFVLKNAWRTNNTEDAMAAAALLCMAAVFGSKKYWEKESGSEAMPSKNN
ncbi:MAG: hypothetical protein LIO94_09260 [Clostridiales bacterium]|nr:hypothetical protein [Clostridiales bacterium]